MEKLLKDIDKYLDLNPEATIEDIENYIIKNYSKEESEKYFELMGDVLGGFSQVLENPVEAFLENDIENIIQKDDFTIIKNPKENILRKLKVKEWTLTKDNFNLNNCSFYIMKGNSFIKDIEINQGDLIIINSNMNIEIKNLEVYKINEIIKYNI